MKDINQKPTLINVFDPLCGWCYGFGPVFIALQDRHGQSLNFDVISGGMITGSRVGPLSHMREFIKKAFPVVEEHTGVKFGPGFVQTTLEEGKVMFSSLEPSKVLNVFRYFRPQELPLFSHEIQKLIYWDGIDPTQYSAYLPLFERFGIKSKDVLPLLASKEIEAQTVGDFGRAQKWNVSGFPTCVLQLPDGKAYGISNGYISLAALEQKIQPFIHA